MGVTYLLDTHVLLWLLGEPDRVVAPTRAGLADPANRLLVSAVSALGIATKVRLGKLDDVGLLDAWHRRVAGMGAQRLDITTDHALEARSIQWEHGDPFDRLFAAQAIFEAATLVSAERVFGGLPSAQLLSI